MGAGDDKGAARFLELLNLLLVLLQLALVDGVGIAHDADGNALDFGDIGVLVSKVADALGGQGFQGVLPARAAKVPHVVVGGVHHVHKAQLENLGKFRRRAQGHKFACGGAVGEATLAVGDGQVVLGEDFRCQGKGIVQPCLGNFVGKAGLVAAILVLIPDGAVPDQGQAQGFRGGAAIGEQQCQQQR